MKNYFHSLLRSWLLMRQLFWPTLYYITQTLLHQLHHICKIYAAVWIHKCGKTIENKNDFSSFYKKWTFIFSTNLSLKGPKATFVFSNQNVFCLHQDTNRELRIGNWNWKFFQWHSIGNIIQCYGIYFKSQVMHGYGFATVVLSMGLLICKHEIQKLTGV